MDEDYEHTLPGAAHLRLFIADCFTIDTHPPIARLEVETTPHSSTRRSSLWVVSLLDGALEKFLHHNIGYWVREAELYTDEQRANIRCQVGFSPETGRFLKLLPRNSDGKLNVWMESGPIAHILLSEPIAQLGH